MILGEIPSGPLALLALTFFNSILPRDRVLELVNKREENFSKVAISSGEIPEETLFNSTFFSTLFP